MNNQSSAGRSIEQWLVNVESQETKRYIQERIKVQMDFYKDNSRKCKKNYQILSTASILIGFLIPIVSIFADGSIYMKVFIAMLGSGSTAITAYLSLKNYRDLWGKYRYSREYLFSVLMSYFMKADIFKNIENQEALDTLLVETCEKYFRAEAQNWQELILNDMGKS